MNTRHLSVLFLLFLGVITNAAGQSQRLVSTPRPVKESEPEPRPPDPFAYLRADQKLHARFNPVPDHPTLEQLLSQLREATGVEMEVASELKNHQPDLGVIQASPKGWHAFTLMRMVCEKDLEEGKWEKTPAGYKLVGRLKLLAVEGPAKPARSWLTLVGVAILVGGSAFAVYYYWFRRAPAMVQATAGKAASSVPQKLVRKK